MTRFIEVANSRDVHWRLERAKKFEAKLLRCIANVSKATCVRIIFTETNVDEKEHVHDFDAPGDIYKTFKTIQKAVIKEYELDLVDVRREISTLQPEADCDSIFKLLSKEN